MNRADCGCDGAKTKATADHGTSIKLKKSRAKSPPTVLIVSIFGSVGSNTCEESVFQSSKLLLEQHSSVKLFGFAQQTDVLLGNLLVPGLQEDKRNPATTKPVQEPPEEGDKDLKVSIPHIQIKNVLQWDVPERSRSIVDQTCDLWGGEPGCWQ